MIVQKCKDMCPSGPLILYLTGQRFNYAIQQLHYEIQVNIDG